MDTHKNIDEMLNSVGIIHMNGRIYDPELGRFLQADPHIQAPDNSQSINRYAYVINNPLNMTDPSGFFFKRMFNAAFKMTGMHAVFRAANKDPNVARTLQVIAGIADATVCRGFCSAALSAGMSYQATGSFSQSIRSAAVPYGSYLAFSEIGEHSRLNSAAPGTNNTHQFGSMLNEQGIKIGIYLTPKQIASQITLHALTGGVIAELNGGKFGHGFISAGFTKGIGTPILDATSANMVAGTLASMVIGGTASELSGGK